MIVLEHIIINMFIDILSRILNIIIVNIIFILTYTNTYMQEIF